jgi:Flp pilus assembly protein TadG
MIDPVRSESGQSTVEFAGTLFWLLLAALFALQLAVAGWTAVSATNAARAAARLESRGATVSQAEKAGMDSLSGKGLSDHASVVVNASTGEADVNVRIPPVFPGIQLLHLAIPAHATMPRTG